MQVTGERLLPSSGEPRSERAPPVEAAAGSRMWPWYLLFGLLVLLVVGGTWWLGTRQRGAPPPELPAEEPASIPLPPPIQAPAAGGTASLAASKTDSDAVVDALSKGLEPSARSSVTPPGLRRRPQQGTGSGRSVFPADDASGIPPPLTGPEPVPVYPAETNRGRVVQLGAYPTRDQAETAWAKVTKRYPYLKTRTKMVNAVYIGSIGGGPSTRMYRLQLGTSSQAQSVVICQQLEKAGLSCVVVY